jgi:hypothetical protein
MLFDEVSEGDELFSWPSPRGGVGERKGEEISSAIDIFLGK